MINGLRCLSQTNIDILALGLNLDQETIKRLKNDLSLVSDHGREIVGEDDFSLIKDWYYMAILSLAKLPHNESSAGNVGIGTANPTYQLELSTDSAAKPCTSTWTIASDARLKDVRAPFNRGLDSIELIPESVSTDKQGFLHLNNDSIIWTLLNAVKELYQHFTTSSLKERREIASVSERTLKLEVENAAKDKKIKALEKENADFKKRLVIIENGMKQR